MKRFGRVFAACVELLLGLVFADAALAQKLDAFRIANFTLEAGCWPLQACMKSGEGAVHLRIPALHDIEVRQFGATVGPAPPGEQAAEVLAERFVQVVRPEHVLPPLVE